MITLFVTMIINIFEC